MWDPLNEEGDSPVTGIVHRYPDRCLFLVTSYCPLYCRYCTRKRKWVDEDGTTGQRKIELMLQYVAEHPEIRDVIVSGGDPLSLSLNYLEKILAGLRAIPHVEIIRFGSRVPVFLPQRIDAEMTSMLEKYHPIWINTHFNHPNEITPESAAACDRLLRAGIPVNNQAVLLRGVNDCAYTMRDLVQGLMKIRVRPYYLYLCDSGHGRRAFPHVGRRRHRDHGVPARPHVRPGDPAVRDGRTGRRRQGPADAELRPRQLRRLDRLSELRRRDRPLRRRAASAAFVRPLRGPRVDAGARHRQASQSHRRSFRAATGARHPEGDHSEGPRPTTSD